MKVTVSPSGEVSVETDSVAEAAQFVAALRRDPYDVPVTKRTSVLQNATPPTEAVEVPVSAVQMETWNWLVANDTERGHTPNEVATAMGVKAPCAQYRLVQLQKKGLVYRHKGHYRAGEEA